MGVATGAARARGFYGPQGIAADSGRAQLYVADTPKRQKKTIRRVTPAGAVSTFRGAPGKLQHFDGTGTNAQFFPSRSRGG